MKPQTIQIFLPDGSPTSIREAELTNRLVKAILFPRNKISEVSQREMIHFTGVYFLFGTDDDGTNSIVYIGEGENCYKRIKAHNRRKDFWTHCVMVTTKTDEYTKTDVKYLEHYCLEYAQKIGRYRTYNDTGSRKPSIPEGREHDLLDNFETLKILLATLGYPLFEEKRKTNSTKELFYCEGKKAEAKGEFTDDGFLVLKGSTANLEEVPKVRKWVTSRRDALLKANVLTQNGDVLEFREDQIFSSPSAASCVVLGRSSNGWKEWKDHEGKTLDEVKRK